MAHNNAKKQKQGILGIFNNGERHDKNFEFTLN